MTLLFQREQDVSETGSDSFLSYKWIRKNILSWVWETELVSIAGHILPEQETDPVSEKCGFRRSKKFTNPVIRLSILIYLRYNPYTKSFLFITIVTKVQSFDIVSNKLQITGIFSRTN
jgi:hypothetical protein